MPNEIIEDYVDIYTCPTPYETHPTGNYTQIISGDLHGNAIKILFLAVKHGITSNLSPSKYEHFVTIYKKSFTDLQAEDLLQFNQLLNETEFKTEATIHWLGDMLADRGGNDFLTLLILKRLHQCGVKFEIILSNHDFEFIANYESTESNFSSTRLLTFASQFYSMTQMHKLLMKGLITRAEINTLMEEIYLPALKLLSYLLDEEANSIRLVSHAPIDIKCVKALANRFNVSFNETSFNKLSQTIDEINYQFTQHYVLTKKISSLVSSEIMTNPVTYAIWNRDIEQLQRLHKIHDYRVTYIHGHDNQAVDELHVINLDNELGKKDGQISHNNIGVHTAFCSHETTSLLVNIDEVSLRIMTAADFHREINYLNPEQRTVVFLAVNRRLFSMTMTCDDFRMACEHLNREQRTVVFQTMQERLPGIIKTADDFNSVLKYLNREQRTVVCQAMQERLPGIIQTADDFKSVLKYLNQEQRTVVCQGMQAHLPGIIKTVDDFEWVLENLDPEQRTVVFQVMQADLPGIVQNINDFIMMLRCLNPEECAVLFQKMQAHIPYMIRTTRDFIIVFAYLNPEQRTVVFQAMQAHLPGIIKTIDAFKWVLETLDPEQRTVVFQVMQADLPGIVQNINDFIMVLRCLNHDDCAVFFQKMQAHIPYMIRTTRDFIIVFAYLNPEQRTVVFQAMQAHLPGIIKTIDAFKWVLETLNHEPEKISIFCQTMQAHLPGIIKTMDDFWFALQCLDSKQCVPVYQALKPNLVDKILSREDFMKMIASLDDRGKQLALISCFAQDICSPKDQAYFEVLWNRPVAANHNIVVDPMLLRAAQVLNEELDGNFSLKQVFFFRPKRASIPDVAKLVHEIRDGHVKDKKELQHRLLAILLTKECHFEDSFFARIGFIAAQLQQIPSAEASPARVYSK